MLLGLELIIAINHKYLIYFYFLGGGWEGLQWIVWGKDLEIEYRYIYIRIMYNKLKNKLEKKKREKRMISKR